MDLNAQPDRISGHIDTDNAWVGQSPGGHPYTMTVRPGTSDWNTCASNGAGHDEYRIPYDGLAGWALDIGAHIGAVTVPLLLDNPRVRVVAVEALPENAMLLHHNLRRNGLDGRAIVVNAAASDAPGDVAVRYGGDAMHQYIGNTDPSDGRTVTVKAATLRGLMLLRGVDQDAPWSWAKLDCEGCEYPLLASPWVSSLAYITGEVHRGWDRLVQLLQATHQVTGPGLDFGPFQARLLPVPQTVDPALAVTAEPAPGRSRGTAKPRGTRS